MKSYISMFEIPSTDISRAINFFQELLNIKIEKIDVEGMEMGIFPYEEQTVTAIQTFIKWSNNIFRCR